MIWAEIGELDHSSEFHKVEISNISRLIIILIRTKIGLRNVALTITVEQSKRNLVRDGVETTEICFAEICPFTVIPCPSI